MQFDSLRAFPYPVLRPDVDDYVAGDIQVVVEFVASDDGGHVSADVSFLLSVEEIKKQVEAGSAQYVVVFACRDTYFRQVAKSASATLKVDFPVGTLRGEVEAYPYVVATSKISKFKSSWINSEFGEGPFSYDVGNVLAIDRPQTVYIDRDVFKPLSSIFVLVKDELLAQHEWRIRVDGDKVQIAVCGDLKEKLDIARNSLAHRAVLLNSLYFSAAVQCIAYLKRDGGESEGKRWATVIHQKCQNAGIDLDAHDEYVIAQRLMKSPFRLLETYVFSGVDA